MHIRDPIHGSIDITPAERNVIDSRFYQRLRHIKQLGFSDLAFPGATHSRYAHGLGAMQVASRLFDALYRDLAVPPADRARLRQTLRLSVLLHDLGHPPLSHTSERILPPRADLGLPAWTGPGEHAQATHEDMTLLLILQSGLAEILRTSFADLGISPEHVASLVCGRPSEGPNPFLVAGVDHAPILRQLVSSELDADRMDYLLRDSFYTGVHYGRYDLDWIAQNVEPVEREGALYLGLSHRAAFAFEDFLLSRYHMFLSVYYHHTSINYEQILQRFYETSGDEFRLGPDPEAYVLADDVALVSALRKSSNPWAKRIVDRRGFHLLVEVNPFEQELDLDPLVASLEAAGIPYFKAESRGTLSKYFLDGQERAPILVRTSRGLWERIEDYTPLFRRYAESARLVRVYVAPEERERARALAGPLARR
jgi:HD superfamily phosphohydrolase